MIRADYPEKRLKIEKVLEELSTNRDSLTYHETFSSSVCFGLACFREEVSRLHCEETGALELREVP
ncbi:hypothetical protein L195_g013615 [Trifolium pratense]|uniref:Uncharacterized protein n=1 Tax=Trifolium pratense TaxID=57577 RepID=A0A2K3MUZ5_TRIPR|nr:hypothetical protein L195_g017731 [Trifolium pratense]PNY16886.1 hypothetical protein L195_g013615 [Trifolium pratense]